MAPIRNSRLVDVKFRSPDAALATSVVNALAKSYIEQSLEFKFTASKDASDWLGGQLASSARQSRRRKPSCRRIASRTTPSRSRIARTSSSRS